LGAPAGALVAGPPARRGGAPGRGGAAARLRARSSGYGPAIGRQFACTELAAMRRGARAHRVGQRHRGCAGAFSALQSPMRTLQISQSLIRRSGGLAGLRARRKSAVNFWPRLAAVS
jgi:hypothetical protein